MRRQLAGDAEVAGRAHEAGAEDFLPEAIDRDARRQRMLGPQQPLREAEAILRQIGRASAAERRAWPASTASRRLS